MRYTLKNGKTVNISDKELENSMKALGLTKSEAVQMWLEDNDYEVNEEQDALDKAAKKVKIQHGAGDVEKKNKPAKPRIVQVSDTKKALFETILRNVDRCEGVEKSNVTVLRENKLIQVQIGEDIFKIDLIQQRKPKK